MQIINVLDEQDRFIGIKATLSEKPEQEDSHSQSYLYTRELYKEMGYKLGFDLREEKKEWLTQYKKN